MAKENPTSHAFFFTILFMTSIVILTVVGYFLFLPNTAPKLITVGVLPFDAADEFPEHLTRAFPRHITEILAESRDVFVVDYDASEEAVALKSQSRGYRNELGTTHIVDGDFKVADEPAGEWVLHLRLIDVAKDVWKLKWSDEFAYPELSLLEIRDGIVKGVTDGLYDKSIPERSSTTVTSAGLELYLRASSLFQAGKSDNALDLLQTQFETNQTAYGAFLLAELQPESQREHVALALSLQSYYYPAKVTKSQLRYEDSKNLVNYLGELISLAGEYPNSDAVQEVALLYTEFGWFDEAKDVLIRWALIRPRSSEPALAIAFNRFRMNDLKGVAEALEIARLRDPDNEVVDRYRALYEWKVNGTELKPGASEYLNWIVRHENNDFVESNPQWLAYRKSLSCFEQVELSLYLSSYNYIYEKYECIDRRLWLQPPPWWTVDDPKWLAFQEDARYDSWLEVKGIRSDVLDKVEPVPAKELFAPRRKVLNYNNNAD